MDTLVRMQADEITTSLLDFIKSSFKGKKIALHIYEEKMDETEYLLSNEDTKKRLLQSIEDAKNKIFVKEYTMEEIQNILNETEA